MKNSHKASIACGLLAGGLIWVSVTTRIPAVKAAEDDVKLLPNTAMLSGTVDAPKPFKAAKVYAMNVDKNILYMVYTSSGRYRAVNLFPGRYEVSVQKRGFSSPVQKIELKEAQRQTVNVSLREAPGEKLLEQDYYGPAPVPGYQHVRIGGVKLVPYDELYPPGPGRELVEKACLFCHAVDELPTLHQLTEAKWAEAIETKQVTLRTQAVVQRQLSHRPGTFSQAEKETLIAYLTKNFGPNSAPRALRVDEEFPVDEAVLAKAMYVEYFLPLDPKLDAKNKHRLAQEPHFDNMGNVWYTDRRVPNRIGRLDPRTGDIKDYPLPDPDATPHGLTVNSEEHVFWAEVEGFRLGELDPKTGEMTRHAMDSSGKYTGPEGGHTPAMDSKENIWFTVFRGDKIGKWDRQTKTSQVWKVPPVTVSGPFGIRINRAGPYGLVIDKKDKVWFAENRGCKVVMFDPVTTKFTEYPSPSAPCNIRRLGVDSKGIIWYGVYSGGKLGRIDPVSGKLTEITVPLRNSEPYDVWPDANDDVWVTDGGQGGALIKFEQRTEKFTYYPSPRITDMPKVAITKSGALWYTTRYTARTAIGVLYPDVTKITTLGAYY